MRKTAFLLMLLTIFSLLLSCASGETGKRTMAGSLSAGFGSAEIALPEDGPLYIAGYHNGREITGVRDLQRVSAVWLGYGEHGVLLLSVDCVGLSSATVEDIRERLADFVRSTGCEAVHVASTHDHAGLDTLGLWGPIAVDGKNPEFMNDLIEACAEAAEAAYNDRQPGSLSFLVTPTGEGQNVLPELRGDLQRDSRDPQIYDTNLYQIVFTPDEPRMKGSGTSTPDAIRIVIYAAHAESLRGANTLLSRDYPGAMADEIAARQGGRTIFFQSAIGGLIMTRELAEPFDAEQNLLLTGNYMADFVLSERSGLPLENKVELVTERFSVPLDNSIFLYYKFLGILKNPMRRTFSGYEMETGLSIMRMGGVTLALLPGEVFPELVEGEGGLREIAASHGVETLVVVGLCDDEIGYILPEDDFVLHETLPYLEGAKGHYEETNSVGPGAEKALKEAFERALERLVR